MMHQFWFVLHHEYTTIIYAASLSCNKQLTACCQ